MPGVVLFVVTSVERLMANWTREPSCVVGGERGTSGIGHAGKVRNAEKEGKGTCC